MEGDLSFNHIAFSDLYVAAVDSANLWGHVTVWDRLTGQLAHELTLDILRPARLEGSLLRLETFEDSDVSYYSLDLSATAVTPDDAISFSGHPWDVWHPTSDSLYRFPIHHHPTQPPGSEFSGFDNAVISRFTVYDIRTGEVLREVELASPIKSYDLSRTVFTRDTAIVCPDKFQGKDIVCLNLNTGELRSVHIGLAESFVYHGCVKKLSADQKRLVVTCGQWDCRKLGGIVVYNF